MPRQPRARTNTQSFKPPAQPVPRLNTNPKPVPQQTKITTMAEPRKPSGTTRSYSPSGNTQSYRPEPKATPRLAQKPPPPQIKQTTMAEPRPTTPSTRSFSPGSRGQQFSPAPKPAPRLAPNPAAGAGRAAASTVAKRGLGKIAAAAAGPLAGAVATGLMLGEAVKDTSLARKAQGAVTSAAASLTGLAASERAAMGSMSMKVSPRKTTAAPAPSTPSVPSKTVSEALKAPTSKGSTAPAPKSSPKPSQKATGASKSRGRAMAGAELADFLGLGASSAVRANLIRKAAKKK